MCNGYNGSGGKGKNPGSRKGVAVSDLLQRFNRSVTIESPTQGLLLFITDKVTLDSIRSIASLPARITCTDVFGKGHRVSFRLGGDMLEGATEYPHHGVVVKPKGSRCRVALTPKKPTHLTAPSTT